MTCPALLSQSGISPDTTVILYGDNNNWFAAWAYWQLKMYGHQDVRILNGGRKFWLDNGLPLTTDVPSHPATNYRVGQADESHPRLPRRHPAAPRRPGASSSSTSAAPPSTTARSSRLRA